LPKFAGRGGGGPWGRAEGSAVGDAVALIEYVRLGVTLAKRDIDGTGDHELFAEYDKDAEILDISEAVTNKDGD
jgi:hypothetical protein